MNRKKKGAPVYSAKPGQSETVEKKDFGKPSISFDFNIEAADTIGAKSKEELTEFVETLNKGNDRFFK